MKQLELPIRSRSAVLVLLALFGSNDVALAVNNVWQGPNLGDWRTDANWSVGAFPAACCDEVATINNNTTAIISPVPPLEPPLDANGLLLGQLATDTGGLRITNGGSLTTAAFLGGANGAMTIGQAGQGNLTILGGGSLTGPSLSLGGLVGSSILLGDTSGLTATLSTTGAATLNRTTQITGRFVNFSAGANLTFGTNSILVGQINHASLHSPLKSAATANLNGVFRPEFITVTPTVGSTWNIIDALTINGNFSLDTSAAPALPTGQAYAFKRTAGGTNGQLLQLTVEQLLTLRVHRSTGAVSIINTGTQSVTIDGYSILSSRGALTGSWNSLDDQNVPNWVETVITDEDLSELHPQAGGLSITNATPRSLGSPYEAVFPAFGTHPDHLQFEYATPDGQKRFGVVEYEGAEIHNNLILSVDQNTGQAQLKNNSPYTISIDGYTIYSDMGSLQPANGKWFSLEDRGVAGWEQTLSDAESVSETNPDGVLTLSPFSGYDIGELYNEAIGGIANPDPTMRIEFILAGAPLPSEGDVVFGPFGAVPPPGLTGDFNKDGIVNAADYVMWRKTGVPPTDYDDWRENFGRTLGGSGGASQAGQGAAPEPGTIGMLMLAVITAIGFGRRRQAPRHSWSSFAAIAVALVVFAGRADTAAAQELYFEGFDDGTFPAGSDGNLETVANGIASFTDNDGVQRARFVVVQTFSAEVMTFSFDTRAPVTATGGADHELVFRAGIGTGNNTLSSTEFILEAIPFRTTGGGTAGGNRGAYTNNGNESIFVVANNKATDLVFASPIDGSNVTLGAFQYINYVRNNDTSAFGLLLAAPGIANFTDRTPADPGPGTITRFGVGSSSNAHQGTFALDNIRVFSGVSFGASVCDLGDANCDDIVDLENDFEAIRANFRRSPRDRSHGDLTGDNEVDFDDFIQWKGAFLSGGGSLAGVNFDFGSATVPEPATVVGAMVAVMTFVGCSRNRHLG